MSANHSTCPICAAEFRADPSQKAAYDASLWADDRAETMRLLGAINAYWALKHHMAAEHVDKMFVCGRQGESHLGGEGPQAFWEADGTCSYCGSMSPDQFFAAVDAGAQITPTDKSYKAYVTVPTENPGEMEITTSANGKGGGLPPDGEGWILATPEVCERYKWSKWSDGPLWVKPSPRPATREAKFYFQHLDDAGMNRFIELLNAKTMKLAYPGHFYSRPYFIAAPADVGRPVPPHGSGP